MNTDCLPITRCASLGTLGNWKELNGRGRRICSPCLPPELRHWLSFACGLSPTALVLLDLGTSDFVQNHTTFFPELHVHTWQLWDLPAFMITRQEAILCNKSHMCVHTRMCTCTHIHTLSSFCFSEELWLLQGLWESGNELGSNDQWRKLDTN